jgi:hypothetical protein
MVRTKKVLAFPCCFFLRVVAPLYTKELDYFTPCDMILLIQDLDWVLGDKSASSGVTLGNTTSTGAFNHFFNFDMWKMS